jgi:alpha-beta hydrolase superfamily lysophospholipase
MRVYIDAIHSKQIRLYYTKFIPKVKTGQICIIHGYGENTDDYLPVMLHLFRWLSTLPNEVTSST